MPNSIGAPSSWLQRFAPLIPAGEVLDLACGSGRHAHYLASCGYPVLAVDRDAQALAQAGGQGIATLEFDLERTPDAADWPFAQARFAAAVVANYLHRPLMMKLFSSVKADGVLIYETFAAGNEQFGKPSNPAFLLTQGELLALAGGAGWRVVAYEEGRVAAPKPAMVQRICAVGPAFAPALARLDAF